MHLTTFSHRRDDCDRLATAFLEGADRSTEVCEGKTLRLAALLIVRGEGIEPTNHGKTIAFAVLTRCDFPAFARSAREDPTGADLESAAGDCFDLPRRRERYSTVYYWMV